MTGAFEHLIEGNDFLNNSSAAIRSYSPAIIRANSVRGAAGIWLEQPACDAALVFANEVETGSSNGCVFVGNGALNARVLDNVLDSKVTYGKAIRADTSSGLVAIGNRYTGQLASAADARLEANVAL